MTDDDLDALDHPFDHALDDGREAGRDSRRHDTVGNDDTVSHPTVSADARRVLERFSPATQEWFVGSFAQPTPAQVRAWEGISSGQDTLVVAPTGSGKTLAAFLWAIDRLAAAPAPADRLARCRVLYISPLKALAVDVERNLRSPLVGIGHAAARRGSPRPDVRVATRSGDTSAQERRAFAREPADILITTPESLFLLLTSAARDALAGIETVIVDEIHALAGTKRGAHLALSLARLDARLPRRAQRIGLSATVRPVAEVARFLTGGGPAAVVQPPSTKEWDLQVVVPVPDLAELGSPTDDLSGPAAGEQPRASIWPHVEERIVDLVAAHRSTLVFANSRRLAERLTARLNEIWEQRLADAEPDAGDGAGPATRPPAQIMAASGASGGAPAVLARAHHGSVSKEQRALIEDDLKSGRLPAVVATSSLELGIDMGSVDLVVQVESPPSVAGGLQRVGRAGHQVGAISRGIFFPKFRADLVQSAVVVERMREGAIESIHVPANPLDVLAQQIVAMCALDDWSVSGLYDLVRRAAPFASLGRGALDAVLDMLSGRYPSEEFAELRPRIVWDRIDGTLSGRPGAQRLAVTSGGTIPDRGLFGVFLAGGDGPGRRVGELDEEMVYESRVGDVFTLGTSSWRIEEITHDQVLVSPAPGAPGRLPFWKGDTLGRPAELGAAVGGFVRELRRRPDARERLRAAGLDDWAADNLLAYLTEQHESTGHVPDDRTVVVERFRDEIGDWRVAVHTPFGAQVHAPWALCIAARLRERFGVQVQAMHADDGIVLRLPDVEFDDATDWSAQLAEAVLLPGDDVRELVTAELGGSALFASRFRECAARALLLPRRHPGRRQALWQQRQRSAQLLEVASRYPSFPIVLETVRECVQDVFDVPGLVRLLGAVADRSIRVVDVETPQPSPFARSLMFGYVAQFLYEGDSPLAERRAAALSLDPALLAELLGADASSLRDLLDPEVVVRTERELQRLTDDRRCRDAEDVADLVRRLGPLELAEVRARTLDAMAADTESWLHELEAARRLLRVRVRGREAWAAVEDAGRLRDALGVALPVGVPEAFRTPVEDPLGDLLARHARYRGPFTAADAAARFGLGEGVVRHGLARLVADGRLVTGELRPLELLPADRPTGPDFCDAEVLRTLRRRSLAALRAEVEPVTPADYARFLPLWQGVGGVGRGTDGVRRVVEQLAGAQVPAGALESLVLPARVTGYAPHLLDELLAAGEVLWQGHGALGPADGWISLHPADTAELTLLSRGADADLGELHQAVLEALAGGGGYFFRPLSQAVGSPEDARLAEVLWELVWAGRLGNDGLAPLRALLGGGSTHRSRRPPPRSGATVGSGLRTLRTGRRPGLGTVSARSGPPATAGRWSLLPEPSPDVTLRGYATAELLLDRYGVLTRGAVTAEQVPGGFAGVYRVLAAAEDAGRVRRGYLVEGLGATQFATVGAIDRLRALSRPLGEAPDSSGGGAARGVGRAFAGSAAPGVGGGASAHTAYGALVLAATDPANPYGAALPWPPRPEEGPNNQTGHGRDPSPDRSVGEGSVGGRGHRPGRKAGALVVLVDGELLIYLERGGRTLLSWSVDPDALAAGARALATAVTDGALGRLTVERADGAAVLRSGHPLARALADAGFHATPRGLRLRR